MNVKKIIDTLTAVFINQKTRIIFWYDGEKEFEELLPSLSIDGVSILRLDRTSALELKIRLETDDSHGNYLIYSSDYEPAPEDDWLLDIKLYSYTFHADKASILLKELNLTNQGMRPYISARKAFFRSQDRLNRIMKWVNPDDTEDVIDLKMLTVIAKADQPEIFAILMKLFGSSCKDDGFINSEPSKIWTDIEKLGLQSAFWTLMARTFGYATGDTETLTDLLIRIFVTDFSNNFKGELPDALSHFMIVDTTKAMNSSVFLSQWRSNMGHYDQFNIVSKFMADKLNISELIASCGIENLIDIATFEVVERRIISELRNWVIQNNDTKNQGIGPFIKTRLDGYWATAALSKDSAFNLYKTVYHALEMVVLLFTLRKKYASGFSYPTAEKMFYAYTEELYLFDQYYRVFHELADTVELGGWDVLKTVRESVESCYSGWYMEQLSLIWVEFIDKEKGMLEHWSIPNITNQYDFYKNKIKPALSGSERNRIFVIISDAFRYEAAQELTQIINGKYRLKASLDPMLGILPSYTALGMASLLPHKSLSFRENSSDVLVDSRPTGSFINRSDILKKHNGIAIKADDLLAMTKETGRDFVKPHRVVYVYHDQIDATGDKAASEGKTFEAVRRTIQELSSLVNFIVNSINGTRIMITADHGFIYQEKAPEQIDRNGLDIQPDGAVKSHKRFILGNSLGNTDKALTGSTRVTAKTEKDMDFWLPKGNSRFHFVGGARFFHGGAMLQEITIPVITVTEMKGRHREKSAVKMAGVSILGAPKKIVTNIPRFEFIQTDEISDRVKPRVVKISLRDGNELISSEETITFDSASSSMEQRKKSVRLPLKSVTFDNKKEYWLVIRNAIDDTEYDRIPVTIDIAFANDF